MGLSFSLDPAVPMSEAVRRVACAEIDAAYAAPASPPDRHRGVHDARKCLKRLRSLLVLIRPGLPEPVFLSLTDRLRTIARGLAPARDAHALLDAIDKLDDEPRARGSIARSGPCAPGCTAAGKRRRGASRATPRPTLCAACSRSGRPWPTSRSIPTPSSRSPRACANPIAAGAKPSPMPLTAAATRTSTSGGRRCSTIGATCNCSTPCWPSELSARVEASRDLSQVLGDDHDIALVRQLVSAPTMVFASPEDTAAFLKRCRTRHKALRREAQTRGARLFAERSRPFVERIEAYWLTAAQARRRDPAMHRARADNVVAFGDLVPPGGRAS